MMNTLLMNALEVSSVLAQARVQMSDESASVPLGVPILFCGFGLVALLSFVFWIWMLIDCLQREFADGTEKIVWVLVLIFTQVLGAIIYFFVGRPRGAKSPAGGAERLPHE